jgi:hypothetical protein
MKSTASTIYRRASERRSDRSNIEAKYIGYSPQGSNLFLCVEANCRASMHSECSWVGRAQTRCCKTTVLLYTGIASVFVSSRTAQSAFNYRNDALRDDWVLKRFVAYKYRRAWAITFKSQQISRTQGGCERLSTTPIALRERSCILWNDLIIQQEVAVSASFENAMCRL